MQFIAIRFKGYEPDSLIGFRMPEVTEPDYHQQAERLNSFVAQQLECLIPAVEKGKFRYTVYSEPFNISPIRDFLDMDLNTEEYESVNDFIDAVENSHDES